MGRGRHTVGIFEEEPYDFARGEPAFIPGSPGRPQQPAGRRLLYFIVSLVLLLTSGLANALVSVNATYLRGSLGADSQEIAWLPVVYSMTFVSMNLLLVRFRQQFGLRLYAMVGLMGLAAIILLHVSVGGLQGAIVVHALAGIANAPLATLGVYYMMTAAPPKQALQSVILALGLTQVPTPNSSASTTGARSTCLSSGPRCCRWARWRCCGCRPARRPRCSSRWTS